MDNIPKPKAELECQLANDVNATIIDAGVTFSYAKAPGDNVVIPGEIEVVRFKEAGIANLQLYITSLEAVVQAVIDRRNVSNALKGKATMHDGLIALREVETKMQDAVDRVLE